MGPVEGHEPEWRAAVRIDGQRGCVIESIGHQGVELTGEADVMRANGSGAIVVAALVEDSK